MIQLHVYPRFSYRVLGVTIELIAHFLSFFFSFLPVLICRTSGAAAKVGVMGTLVSVWRWLVVIGLFLLAIVLILIYHYMIVCYPDTTGEVSEQDTEPV